MTLRDIKKLLLLLVLLPSIALAQYTGPTLPSGGSGGGSGTVTSVASSTGLTGGTITTTGTLSFDYSATAAGNPALTAGQCVFDSTDRGIICEGATANSFEGVLAMFDVTADRTWTFPDVTGTVVTTGDTGSVTSVMIANATIVSADISGTAGITDAQVSDTLTSSSFVGSGSTTTAVDLATAEASGVLTLAKGGSGADLSATGGANQFVKQNSLGGNLSVGSIADADVPNNITIDSATNATTANALAANGTNCSAGSYPLGVDASGNAESCTATGAGTVTSVATSTGLTGGTITSTGTLSFSYSSTQGANPALTAGQSVFDSGDAQGGLLFEGTTANNFESLLTVVDPTADNVWTLPDATGTVVTTGNLSAITGLADSQISDTLTSSVFKGSGTTTDAVDLATSEVNGILTLAKGGTGTDLSATGGANQFVKQTTGGGVLTVGAISDSDVPNNITIDLATAANALAVDGSNCGAGNYPLGIDVGGNVQNCTAAPTGTVTSVATGTGLTGGTITSTGTILLSYSSTQAANPALTAGQAVFDSGDAQGGLLFEGLTADNFEGLLTVADPTADDVWTLPDVTGTVVTTGNLSAISGLTDSQISDTLTASVFKGSGSTTDAIDLATAEVAGTLADANVIDALTINGGTVNNSVIGGSTPAAATLTTLNLSSGTGSRFLTTDGSKNVAYTGASADLANTLSDETGDNLAVFSGSPTITNSSVSGNALNVSCSATTTGFCINSNDSNALTTGAIARFVSNSADTGTRNLLFVRNQNSAATGTTVAQFQQDSANTAVTITQNANGNGLLVQSNATTANAIRLTPTLQTSAFIFSVPAADSLTSGGIFNGVSNSADTTARNIMFVRQQNASATNAVVARFQQDGPGGAFVVDRTNTASTNAAWTINDANASSGGSIRINKTGTGYGNNLGLIDVVRTGAFTGVAGEIATDIRVSPGVTMTEPAGAGLFSYAPIVSELSSLAVTAGGGTSQVAAAFFNGSNDADIDLNYSLLTGANGKVGLGNNAVFLNSTAQTATDYAIGKNGSGDFQINRPTGTSFNISRNGTNEVTIGTTGILQSTNGLQIGASGNTILAHYSGTATNLTSASIAGGTCGNYGSITVTGAIAGDTVLASPDAASSATGIEDSNLIWSAAVVSSNTVGIRACNPTALAIDAGDDQEWRADVWHH